MEIAASSAGAVVNVIVFEAGYTFDGWNTKEDGTEVEINDAYNQLIKSFSELKLKPNKNKLKDLEFQMPRFQNGDMTTFCYWMSNNIKYPQEAIDSGLEGKVIFSFIVETDGSLSEFKILQSPSVILSKEVERVFNNSPKWEPGLYMDKKVRVRLTVPVVLVIQR